MWPKGRAPGQRLREVHHTVIEAKSTQERLGLDFSYAHNGHSLGLNIHEHPIIGPRESIAYAPGMITTVETRARVPGRLGYHMEDIVEITERAPILHARYFPNEELLGQRLRMAPTTLYRRTNAFCTARFFS